MFSEQFLFSFIFINLFLGVSPPPSVTVSCIRRIVAQPPPNPLVALSTPKKQTVKVLFNISDKNEITDTFSIKYS